MLMNSSCFVIGQKAGILVMFKKLAANLKNQLTPKKQTKNIITAFITNRVKFLSNFVSEIIFSSTVFIEKLEIYKNKMANNLLIINFINNLPSIF
ncbi:unnamed protein product [marine sediment metagenome]|uniref:Uncharacterized protein n=1 Tax=marine sediment metagenome TaxID=412755 RepID=X1F4G3_9ZZZZ